MGTLNRVLTQYCGRNALHLELSARALRNSLWLAIFHAQGLQLHAIEHRLTVTLVEVDQLLEGLDEDA